MKSYIHAPGIGVELNTYKKQDDGTYEQYKRQDLKTGYFANIDAVENAMQKYDCVGMSTAWLRSNDGKGATHQICQFYQELKQPTNVTNTDNEIIGQIEYGEKIVINSQETWNTNHAYYLSQNIPFGYSCLRKEDDTFDKYQLDIPGNVQKDKWGIIKNKSEDGGVLINGLPDTTQFLVLNETTYFKEATDSEPKLYKKIVKLPDNFPELICEKIEDEDNKYIWKEKNEQDKNVYISEVMLAVSQVFTEHALDILSIYNIIIEKPGNNIKGAVKKPEANYRVHVSQMRNTTVSVYPFQLAVKQKLLELDDNAYKSQYWPITPIFIPSAAEFGIAKWISTNPKRPNTNIDYPGVRKHEITFVGEEGYLGTELGKFVEHWSIGEDGNHKITYQPRFKYDPTIYTWKQGEEAPEHWLWLRDIVPTPNRGTTADDLPYVQIKLNLNAWTDYPNNKDDEWYNRLGPNAILGADQYILSAANTASDKIDKNTPGKNTKAYIAPAFTIRPARNMHPNDNYEEYEAIQY